ncbi:cold-shock protein [Chloroflexota bacterium]
MPKGTIRRLVTSYGFIKTEQGEDLFFHSNQLQGVKFYSLREGQEVEFELGQGRDGRPNAVRVRLAARKSSQDEAATSALEDWKPTPGEPQAEETMQGDQD